MMMILMLHATDNELEIHATVVRMACCRMIHSYPTTVADDGAVAVDAVNERGVTVVVRVRPDAIVKAAIDVDIDGVDLLSLC
jgi:hypothetical protein